MIFFFIIFLFIAIDSYTLEIYTETDYFFFIRISIQDIAVVVEKRTGLYLM